ncbi:MAG: hypothetical protein NC548_26925 [Lachnospiraceae bacterium]|nr:hypothetical protein [Lachnospiraceae bacterium]
MAVTSGFFNSINGDRKYDARQIGMYLGKLVSSGVFPNPSTNLQVTAAGGMNIQVHSGRAMIDGHWMDNDSAYEITLDDADMALARIDAVVMRLDENDGARSIDLTVKKGTPSAAPESPVMERAGYVQEYCLALVNIPAVRNDGTQEIIQANITDTRADTNVCGWVTNLIQHVDTSTLFLQWQDAYQRFYNASDAEFHTWLNGIKTELGNSVVGALTSAINGKADKDAVDEMAKTVANLQNDKADNTAVNTLSQNLTRMNIQKGDKASVAQVIIPAADWKGDTVPYMCTVQIPGVTADSIVELSLASGATKDQAGEWLNAQILDGGQEAGNITLRAFGWKPTLNLPVVAVVWN